MIIYFTTQVYIYRAHVLDNVKVLLSQLFFATEPFPFSQIRDYVQKDSSYWHQMTCQSLTRISWRTSLSPGLQTFNHFFTILGSCTLTSYPSPASGLSAAVLANRKATLHAALPRRNATNCDNNPNQLLKYHCEDLSPVITHLFNGSSKQKLCFSYLENGQYHYHSLRGLSKHSEGLLSNFTFKQRCKTHKNRHFSGEK